MSNYPKRKKDVINYIRKENGLDLENGNKLEFGDYVVKEKDGFYVYKPDTFKKIFKMIK